MQLLAPAGDLTKLKYALAYGADAVYCGVPDFSLRVRVNKFTQEDLEKGITYAHQLGKKVYVTLNIYPHNQQLDEFKKYLPQVIDLKPDAIIVADPGILNYIRGKYPRQELHLSTQANALNYGAVAFWKKQGVKRIILARETSLKEVKEIKQKVPGIELEYFGHGAMCMAYSGRCLLSSWLNARSANEGDCTQPCRWPWRMEAAGKEGIVRQGRMEEDQHGTYIMNSRDLCLIEHLAEMEKSGIDCVKIEGRNKSLYYLTTVVKYYGEALKALKNKDKKEYQAVIKTAKKEFKKLGNREYTLGFAFGLNEQLQNYEGSNHAGAKKQSEFQLVGEYLPDQVPVKLLNSQATTSSMKKNANLAAIKVHNAIFKGQTVEAIAPQSLTALKVLEIFDHKQQPQESAHGGTDKIWYIRFDKPLTNWTILRA